MPYKWFYNDNERVSFVMRAHAHCPSAKNENMTCVGRFVFNTNSKKLKNNTPNTLLNLESCYHRNLNTCKNMFHKRRQGVIYINKIKATSSLTLYMDM